MAKKHTTASSADAAPEWITTKEAADRLDCSQRTIQRYVKLGMLPHKVINATCMLVDGVTLAKIERPKMGPRRSE